MKTPLHHHPVRHHSGSVIAITVLFMSFLLIGIVGAAYLLSSHLRITSLSGDYLQATYNAESAMELALYRLKNRFEGYEGTFTDNWKPFDPQNTLINSFASSIQYRMKPGEKADIPLNGGNRKFALFYEETNDSGTIQDLASMSWAIPLLATSADGATGDCLEVNLSGTFSGTGPANGIDESISAKIPCSPTAVSLASLSDPYPFTPSRQGTAYSFREFIQTHKRVYMLVKDISTSQKGKVVIELPGSAGTQTIARPKAHLESKGTFASTTIQLFFDLDQEQVADITGNVLVTP